MLKNWSILIIAMIAIGCQPEVKEVDEFDIVDSVGGLDTVVEELESPISSDIAAYKTVVNIIRETGLAQNFVIIPGEVENVKAYIKNNERILEYNPNFMEKLDSGDTNWHGISVLAREIGHHLSNHNLDGETKTSTEKLEADKYAGFVLYKMGASLDEAMKALESVIVEDTTGSGSAKNDRISALVAGWNSAEVLGSDTTYVEQVPEKKQEAVVAEESEFVSSRRKHEDYVYQVFLALDSSIYFVDEKDIIYVEKNQRYTEIGIKKDSDKPGFDWIFVKGEDSYGVDLKGRLWAFSIDGNFHVIGQSVKLNSH